MGDRARERDARGRGLERGQPRPGPLARLSERRGRPRRLLRRPAAALLRRSGSGTGAIRSSRSGCSASPTARGTTARTSRSTTSTSTARRRTPTPRCSTSIRRRRSRTPSCWPRTGGARATSFEYELIDTGVFDRGSLLGPLPRGRQARAGGHVFPDHGGQQRPRAGDAARPPAPLVPQHLVSFGHRTAPAARRPRARAGPDDLRPPRPAGCLLPLLRGGGRAALRRQRDQPLSPVGRAEPFAVSEGRHQRLRRQRAARRGQPRAPGDQGGRALPAHRRPGRELVDPPAADAAAPGRNARSVRQGRRHVRATDAARPTTSTARSSPPS